MLVFGFCRIALEQYSSFPALKKKGGGLMINRNTHTHHHGISTLPLASHISFFLMFYCNDVLLKRSPISF